MQRFDVSCFLGRWSEGGPTLATASELLSAMDDLGIGRALVRHSLGKEYFAPDANDLLFQELAGHERLLPCPVALPLSTGEMGAPEVWLAEWASYDVRAACLYPQGHGYALASWQCDNLLAPLAERRMPVLLELAQTNWDALHWLCGAYPALPVILLNAGYRVLRPLYAQLDAHPNLYLDISTVANFWGIEDLCAHFGAERLLLGTGQPRTDGAGIVTALNYADLAEDKRQAIAARNLERLLQGVQR
jgi:hypothetical protein